MEQDVNMIGHNGPPEDISPAVVEEMSDRDKASKRIDDLFQEAQNWLDGEPIDRQGLADGIEKLMDELRIAAREAERVRKTLKDPLDLQIKEIQDFFNPLKSKANLALDTCKKALEPWLKQQAEEREAEAERLAEDARIRKAEADAAIQAAAKSDNLALRLDAEDKLKDAKKVEQSAKRAAKKPTSTSGASRAATLRTVDRVSLSDSSSFAKHVWVHNKDELLEFLQTIAERLVRQGQRDLPGVTVTTEKVVV